jgi:hypothetical protein
MCRIHLGPLAGGCPRGYNEKMTSQNAPANAKRLFKALVARGANLDEPMTDDRITDVAVQIGLEGDEFDSVLDYAGERGWLEDAEMSDSTGLGFAHACWCGCCEILILLPISSPPRGHAQLG